MLDAADGPVVVGSVLEPDPEATLESLAELPDGCALAEIRADRLRVEQVASAVRRAGRSVVVTVRRTEDGGNFDGPEDERARRLHAALDAGARFVDVELGAPAATGLLRDHAERVILSHHEAPCEARALEAVYRRLAATPAARLKLVPRAGAVAELAAVREALGRAAADGRPLACFALGRAGRASRVLAPSWGSWATYGSVAHGKETGEGQLTARDLIEVYRVLRLGPETRRFALLGRHVGDSPSPAMHHAGYVEAGVDACYLPVDLDALEHIDAALGPAGVLGLGGLAVTVPFKEDAAGRSRLDDDVAREAGAVNTVIVDRPDAWRGYNTDGPAARARIERHLGLDGARVAVVGAGGTAAAITAAVRGAGAVVALFNRGLPRAERLARRLGVRAEPLAALGGARWDVLVNATPLGSRDETVLDPARLTGRVVLDAVYAPRPTPLVRAARDRGLAVVDGFELLVAQAELQFLRLTGRRVSPETLASAGRRWLAGRAGDHSA